MSPDETMPQKRDFTVLEGGRDRFVTVNSLKIQAVFDSLPSLPVDVRVFEEDTFLVLTVDPVMRYKEEHPIRLMTRVIEAKPNKPGSVVINNHSWYAVVHDVNRDPTWNEKWIKKAYREILILAEIKRVQHIGLPLLGSVHGKFPAEQSLAMLIKLINSTSFQFLQKVLILVPPADCDAIWQRLSELTLPEQG